jgi:hypothetical protein
MQRVTVLAQGFAWNGKIYPSLSKIAFAITGTRWNGPKFFGMRDKPSSVQNKRRNLSQDRPSDRKASGDWLSDAALSVIRDLPGPEPTP